MKEEFKDLGCEVSVNEEFDSKVDFDQDDYYAFPEDLEYPKNFECPKEKSHGFHYKMLEKRITVFFEYFNNKIVKCHLIMTEENNNYTNYDKWENDLNLSKYIENLYSMKYQKNCETGMEFIGIAKLNNDEKDVYIKNDGERIALQKAINKAIKFSDEVIDLISIKQENINDMLNYDVIEKLKRVQDKN
jgi:hypothetical protein